MWLEKKWIFNKVEENAALSLAGEAGVSKALAKILLGRGIDNAKAAHDFLYGVQQPFHRPELMQGMPQAVDRICRAIAEKEKIVIYGDYDVDGITASSLLYLFLRGQKALVSYYIPERQAEGYGLNAAALRQIAQEGVSLVITVDCGISAVAEVAGAPAGLDIIITDHHNPPEALPQAVAVLNPKQKTCPYPYKELAGVGVALKLCQGLWAKMSDDEGMWLGHLDLVALGTVADIVPLTGENREIVRLGLKAIQETKNIGLQQLIKNSRCQQDKINTGMIGFALAPRLNAAGRLAKAETGVQLLTTEDELIAERLAGDLDAENCQRQEIEKSILLEAEELLAAQGGVKPVIVLAKTGWHAGVIGIVASRLVDKYHVPVVMIGIVDGQGKGSCRSIYCFDIYKALCAVSGHLLQFGGHCQAAGLTVEADKIEDFRAALQEYAEKTLSPDDYMPVQTIDSCLESVKEADDKLLAELERLEPYGMGNPHPVLAMKGISITEPATIGGEGQHLKFTVRENGNSISAIMWRKGDYSAALYDNVKADIAFVPEVNIWRNSKEIRLRIIDVQQENILTDFRFAGKSKNEALSGILQTGKKTVIYCNEDDELVKMIDGQEIVQFRQLPASGARQAVFWQPPCQVIDDLGWWKELRSRGVQKVYLLFKESDIEAQLAELENKYPGPEKLRDFYRLLRQKTPAGKSEILSCFTGGEIYLHILAEIGAITENGGVIAIQELKEGVKLDLCSSRLFRDMQEKQQKARITLTKCMELEQRDFAKLLFA